MWHLEKERSLSLSYQAWGMGVQTVKGKAQLFSLSYRLLAKRYKIYVFSRINELRQGYTTRDMAADVAEAMETLNLDAAYVMGISQGGMIAQWLAADFQKGFKGSS